MIIDSLFVVLAMAGAESCATIPQSHKDSETIVSMAWELFSDRPKSSEFEFAEVEKCTESVVLDDGREKYRDKTTFVGRFSDRSSIPDVRIHDAVSCNQISYLISGIPDESSQRCTRRVQTYLTYPGITKEISVSEGTDIDAVRQYLGYLSRQVGSIIDGRVFTEDEYLNISIVKVLSNKRLSHFHATYSVVTSSCKTERFKATATGDSVYEFQKIKREGLVC